MDIFVYPTAAAMTAAGGRTAIETLIAQGVANSNTACSRSGLSATKRSRLPASSLASSGIPRTCPRT
ncbi:MAG: hypothetical protein R2712_12525 [Vicinamibacterales bacterium]